MSDDRTTNLREALSRIADLGSCAHARTPQYKLFQKAIDLAMDAISADDRAQRTTQSEKMA